MHTQTHFLQMLPIQCFRSKMDLKHRKLLKENRVQLVQDIDPAEVLDYLQEDGVFSENDCELVLNKPNRKERCRQLLALLPNRGQIAFDAFTSALTKSKYSHLEQLLNAETTPKYVTPPESGMNSNDHDACARCQPYLPQFYKDRQTELIVRRHCCLLSDNVEAKDLLDHYYQGNIISDDEYEIITSKDTRRSRFYQFVHEISKSSGDNLIPMLKESLRKKYKFIVDKIEETEIRLARTECRDSVHQNEQTHSTPTKSTNRQYNTLCGKPTSIPPLYVSSFKSETTHCNESSLPDDAQYSDLGKGGVTVTDGCHVRTDDNAVACKAKANSGYSVVELKAICLNQDEPLRDTRNFSFNKRVHYKKKGTETFTSFNFVEQKVPMCSDVRCWRDMEPNGRYSNHENITCRPTSSNPLRISGKKVEIAFNHLSTLINTGQFDKFEHLTNCLKQKYICNPDMMCVLGYLSASRDLFKTDFISAKKHICDAFQMLPKTSNPKYFTLELFTLKTRMYVTQKRMDKLKNVLGDAKMIIEADPVGCTGRAAGWLFMNDARNKTAQMSTLNCTKRNYIGAYNTLHTKAKQSFQLAMINFQQDSGSDGPFGFGYALCRLVILLLRCGDNGLTMAVLVPDYDDIKQAGVYIRQLEDSNIAIPKILEMHFLLAKTDYQFRRDNFVRALEHAQNAFDLASQLNLLEFKEHAHNRLVFLNTKHKLPSYSINEKLDAARILLEDSSGVEDLQGSISSD